eukprot:TRINITY_DN32170_c0_g1_i1.p1 TRINITY_DN32170_c0_g1~~TRINITY_DN32170_c0_g1_i1.p1  ORF type:complete len:523 (+),score=99.09 TRINITY_DN32170_c0_g1_i1:43-1569(+)
MAWPYPAQSTLHAFSPTPPLPGSMNAGREPLHTPAKTVHFAGPQHGWGAPPTPRGGEMVPGPVRQLSPVRGAPNPQGEAAVQREAELVGLVKELSQANGRLKGELEMVKGENEVLKSANDALRAEVESYRDALRTGRLRGVVLPAGAQPQHDTSQQSPLQQSGTRPVGRAAPTPGSQHTTHIPPSQALFLKADDGAWDTAGEEPLAPPDAGKTATQTAWTHSSAAAPDAVQSLHGEVAELRAMCSTISDELRHHQQQLQQSQLTQQGGLSAGNTPKGFASPINSPFSAVLEASPALLTETCTDTVAASAASRQSRPVRSTASGVIPQAEVPMIVTEQPSDPLVPMASHSQPKHLSRAHSAITEVGGKTPLGSMRVTPSPSNLDANSRSRPQSQSRISSFAGSRSSLLSVASTGAAKVRLGFVGEQCPPDGRGKPQVVLSFTMDMCLADRADDIVQRLGLGALEEAQYFLNVAKLPEVQIGEPLDPMSPLETISLRGSQAVVYYQPVSQ